MRHGELLHCRTTAYLDTAAPVIRQNEWYESPCHPERAGVSPHMALHRPPDRACFCLIMGRNRASWGGRWGWVRGYA